MDASIILITGQQTADLDAVVKAVAQALDAPGFAYEILLLDNAVSETMPRAVAGNARVRVVKSLRPDYGQMLRDGFAVAQGEYVITLDADNAAAACAAALWQARHQGEMIIASRYVSGGQAEMSGPRRSASPAVNRFISRGLNLRVRDVSSGNRLYKAAILRNLKLEATGFDILAEIAVRVFGQGWKIVEIPFVSMSGQRAQTDADAARAGWSFLSAFARLWRLRNSIDSADYDDRAYDSIIPLQRYWQRKRYEIVTRFASRQGLTLDIGCGSSRMIKALTPMVGLDILLRKLRYARKFGNPLVNGSIWELPFPSNAFDCVVCSEVIEHIPSGDMPFTEMRRVLKPGGRLVLGTPDYGPPWWRMFEAGYKLFAPGGYADEHITQYTRASLIALVERHGFVVNEFDYILGSELILSCTLAGQSANENQIVSDEVR